MAQAFEDLELAGENLRNTGVFLVKNVLSSFEKNPEGVYALKPGHHDNPIQAILEIEKAIAACNATRTAKGRDKKEKSFTRPLCPCTSQHSARKPWRESYYLGG